MWQLNALCRHGLNWHWRASYTHSTYAGPDWMRACSAVNRTDARRRPLTFDHRARPYMLTTNNVCKPWQSPAGCGPPNRDCVSVGRKMFRSTFIPNITTHRRVEGDRSCTGTNRDRRGEHSRSSSFSVPAQRTAMLRMWKRKNGAASTYRKLADVLSKCDRQNLVDEIGKLVDISTSVISGATETDNRSSIGKPQCWCTSVFLTVQIRMLLLMHCSTSSIWSYLPLAVIRLRHIGVTAPPILCCTALCSQALILYQRDYS